MTPAEILQAVQEAHPKMMAKTAQIVAITESLHPEFVEGITKDFSTICGMVMEKTAEKATGWKPYAIGVGATAASGLLGAIATDLYDAAKKGLTKGSNFRRIMEVNPSLKREVDGRSLRLAYDALHRFAPDFTADPLIGGALLKQVAELPQMSHKTIVELIGARKDIMDGKGRHFQDMARQGAILVPDKEEMNPGQLEHSKATFKGEEDARTDIRRHRLAKKLEDYKYNLRSQGKNKEPGE